MSDPPTTPDDSAGPPAMVLPAAVAATRAARLGARGRLRQELIDSRAALRSEREAAAAAALVRNRRWLPRGARPAEAPPPPPPAPAATPREAEPAPQAAPVESMAGAPAEPAWQPDASTGSVFASIMGGLARMAPAPEPEMAAPAEARPPPPPPAAAVSAPPPPPAAFETTGTVTALGPGMLARLRLLGYAQLSDLAEADPSELRRALGDISRLLNVEAWIEEARRQARGETGG